MMKGSENKTFLTSNWLRLASANYVIDPALLQKYLPEGTRLESFNEQHFVSLVAFRYSQTKLLNVRIPFHHTFEEINLRFYVQREVACGKWRSEVAFTKLFFPKRALTFVANTIYKEHYKTAPMNHNWKEDEQELFTSYGLKKGDWNKFEVLSGKKSQEVMLNSSEDFFSKQYWGTSRIDSNSCTVYEIEHPQWEVYPVLQHDISFDFNQVFGSEFSHLSDASPDSVHLFNGSGVVVYKKNVLSP